MATNRCGQPAGKHCKTCPAYFNCPRQAYNPSTKYNVNPRDDRLWRYGRKYRSILEADILEVLVDLGIEVRYEWKTYDIITKRNVHYSIKPDFFCLSTSELFFKVMLKEEKYRTIPVDPAIQFIVEAKGYCDKRCLRKLSEYSKQREALNIPPMLIATSADYTKWELVEHYVSRVRAKSKKK
jgi:hypothetical protein